MIMTFNVVYLNGNIVNTARRGKWNLRAQRLKS